MNLGEIRERAKYRARDIGHVLTAPEIWNGHINAAYYKFLTQTEYPLELAAEDIIFEPEQKSKKLPEGVYQVLSVQDLTNHKDLVTISSWRQLRDQFPNPNRVGESTHFRVVANQIHLFPIPARHTQVRTFYYVQPPMLEVDTDEPIIPERYHEALVLGAVCEVHRDDMNRDGVITYDRAFGELVTRAFTELTRQPQGEFTPLPRGART